MSRNPNVYQTKILIKNGVTYHLAQMSWVFACPSKECEFVITARTEQEALTIEDMHYKCAASAHLFEIAARNWNLSPLSMLDDSVQEDVQSHP